VIDRRRFLVAGVALPAFGVATGVYAIGVEPNFMLQIKRYGLTPPGWPADLRLRIVAISDIHAGEPFMGAARIGRIAAAINTLNPDVIVLLGDFNAGHIFVSRAVTSQQIGEALSILRAPLGCYAILGNHDWWHGDLVTSPSDGTVAIRRALRQAGVRVLENDVVALQKDGRPFWLVGLGDQLADAPPDLASELNSGYGLDDLPGALAQVTDAGPIILLAHEPMIFQSVPGRVSLTLCGHTHGGQINLPLLGPVIGEMRFGADVYGHVMRDARHLIISGGLGESVAPVRFMRPPEIVEITLGAPESVDSEIRRA
jgi:hypothetical protein